MASNPPPRSDTTIDAAVRDAASLFREAGLDEPALDARIFVEEATGLDRSGLLGAFDKPIGAPAAAKLNEWVARRLMGEPVWRILGQREFWGLTFLVTPAVLDPRPDTETVVESALDAFRSRRAEQLRILDLGVGSGAILCALLSELPQARGWGVDRSHEACAVAQGNVVRLGLENRALIVSGDWGHGLRAQSFDLVVSNPPYIETGVIPALAREVRDHDPRVALDGGADGLDCYRRIAADLPRLLAPYGLSVLEAGAGQARAIEALLSAAGLRCEPARQDLGRVERAVMARLIIA